MSDSHEPSTIQDDLKGKFRAAFNMLVIRKIASDGYYDMSHFDDPSHALDLMAEFARHGHAELVEEYKEHLLNYPKEAPAEVIDKFYNEIKDAVSNNNVDGSKELTPEEALVIIDFVRMMLPKCDYQAKCKCQDECMYQDTCKRKKLIEKIFEKAYAVRPNIKCVRALIFDSDKIEVKRIDSVSGLLSELEDIREGSELSKRTVFYRGQSDSNHLLIPSIMRTNAFYDNERAMYQQLMIECPDDFSKCRTHLERLSKMQHYQLHTRLLDVTRNPLVALHFACQGSHDRNGEVIVLEQDTDKIKDFDSDTVAVLASLPLFTRDEQKDILAMAQYYSDYQYCHNNKCGGNPSKCVHRLAARTPGKKANLKKFNKKNLIHRLVHEVRQEKPGFRAEIVPCHLLKNYFVQALKDTPRIIRQDGAFIICGLGADVAKQLHEFRYLCGCGKKKLIIVDRSNKEKIRGELKSLSIHPRALMPEIENVAPEIVSNIKDQIRQLVRTRNLQ